MDTEGSEHITDSRIWNGQGEFVAISIALNSMSDWLISVKVCRKILSELPPFLYLQGKKRPESVFSVDFNPQDSILNVKIKPAKLRNDLI